MTRTKNLQIVVLGFVVAIFSVLTLMPQQAAAQTYNRDQLIQEIYRLLAEIARIDNQQVWFYQQPTFYYEGFNGRVLGASNSTRSVEVETLRAIDVEDDEASVYGDVDLNGQRFATVWFEYGEDRDDLDERSRSGEIDRNDRSSFRADLRNLDEDERYYYRAVARGADGRIDRGTIRSFETDDDDRRSRNDDDEPDVDTGRAFDIDEDSARFDGEIDMNDFDDGRVFFAYGEDEDQIEDIEDDYDEYRDIDEDGDDLQLILVDSSLDGSADYEAFVRGLDEDTEYFFTICVEYEDEDDDETIMCGSVEDFETDRE